MSTELGAPLARVCRVLQAPRLTAHYRRRHLQLVADGQVGQRSGPVGAIGDDQLVELIREVITESPFAGEGYRKIRARLRRQHDVYVSGKRVLRLLRREGLLVPQRAARRRSKRLHEGSIIPAEPNQRWGTDGTMAWTLDDGWVWVFDAVDHYTAEAWAHVSKVGDRFAALQPIYDAVLDRHGALEPDIARGVEVRHDWGSQYRSHHFAGSLQWLGIADSPPTPVSQRPTGAPNDGSRLSSSNACGRGPTAGCVNLTWPQGDGADSSERRNTGKSWAPD